MKILNVFLGCILCVLLSIDSNAQQGNAIAILSEKDKSPLEGVILIFQPIEQNSKSVVFFTDENGKAFYSGKTSSLLTAQLMGYKTFSQTIEPDKSYSFYLEEENVELNEVVVTGQYSINTTDKSVYSVKVLDEKTIASKSATSLTELLSTELNIRLSEDNILGTGISVNGLSGQNVKILIDGVPLIGRENGNLDISQINLNDIERVEIIEGPMSVMYGTDAIGGLINLITKQSSRHGFESNLNLNYETIGTYNIDGNIYCKNKRQHFSLSGGRYFFDGFSSPDTSRNQQWKPWEKYFAAVEYGFKTKWVDGQIKMDASHQLTQNKGIPVITPYEAYAFDDYYTTNRFNFTLLNDVRFKNTGKIQLTNAYSLYQRINNTYNKDLVSLTQFLVDSKGSQDTTLFTAYLFRGAYSNTNPSKLYSFQTGYDINLESGKGVKLQNGRQSINDLAAFGSIEFKLNNLLLRPGLRIAYNSRFGEPIIPSLNLKYKVSDKMQLRASYSRGFRAPSLKELDLYFVDVNHNIHGNENLKAEHSDHYNFSVSYQNSVNKQLIKLDYSLFYNTISDIITLALIDNTNQYYSYINVEKYQTAGTSIEGQWKAGSLTLQSGFSLTGLYNSLSEKYENANKFSFTPEFNLGATLHSGKLKTDFSLYLKNTGTTPGFAVNSQQEVYQTTISSYTLLDVILKRAFWKERINLSAGAKNILNVINVESNAPNGNVHASNDGFLPYSRGRFYSVKLGFKIYKS